MELKRYQKRSLDTIRGYLELLSTCRSKTLTNPKTDGDFPAEAWQMMEGFRRLYKSRHDGVGRHLPCFCLRIPTGGGKTFLAVKTIDLINTNYLKRRTGLVLWVVPTTQIYHQTIKNLRDRDHPYRQHLDIASGGRTVIRKRATSSRPRTSMRALSFSC
jgi:type III restriction enzyme